METSIVLNVEGITLEDNAVLEVLAGCFDDLAWSSHDGQVTATVFTDAPDPVAAAAHLAARIGEHVPGARVTGASEQLVSVGDIADRAGVTTEAIRLWAAGKRRAKTPFPAPRGRISQGRTQMKIWAWGEVVAWLRHEYKLQVEPGLEFLDARQLARLNAILAGVVVEPVAAGRRGGWQRVAADQAFDRVLHRIDSELDAAGRMPVARFATV
jgi:hypothetical protein